jgi:solute carrier family 25 folate transporter 32
VNALLSAGVASTVANPLFVLKTRLQTDILNNKPVYNNYVGSVRNILATEGVRSMFKGLWTTIGSNTKLALQFPFYDYLKDKEYNTFTASIVSKTTVSTLFYPADLIRTNQRDTISRLSFMDAAKKTYKSRGISGLYRGVTLYNLMTGPNFVLMMVFKDWLDKLL